MWERTKFNIVFCFCVSRFYNTPLSHCQTFIQYIYVDYIIQITQNKYAILIIHVYNFNIV